MALQPGDKVGAYEIVGAIGAGGMGEVYRARDAKLARDVAIKVLPAELAESPERLARFHREAKVLASLSHSHIGAIHGFEESPQPFLVLELVEGEDLSERLKRGPVPVEEALELARQITEALGAAHDKGIVHRDLKPANIKVTSAGDIKVLDFGLAKAYAPDTGHAESSELSQSPTLTRQGTVAGMILGTAAYMSPEQAKGKTVDKRSDIFAFGAVLFEMLTGRRAFAGDDVSEVLASVLKTEPDWSALPEETPASVERLLRRCLEKDARNRLHDIADARLELDEAPAEPTETAGRGTSWVHVAAAMVLSGLVVWGFMRDATDPPAPIMRFTIPLPDAHVSVGDSAVALSPDGRNIAYLVGRQHPAQIAFRRLDRLEWQQIPSTVDAHFPFFSPGGDWVGFFGSGSLRKVSTDGGPAVTIYEGPTRMGATWSEDDSIYVGARSGLARVSAMGGDPDTVVPLDEDAGETGHRWPHVLPGGETVLFSVEGQGGARRVDAWTAATGERWTVVENASDARYSTTGHLVFLREGSLVAAPFDPDRGEIQGPETPVLGSLRVSPGGSAHFSLSRDGTLVYVTQGLVARGELKWVDRTGASTVILDGHRFIDDRPALSPDGARIAVTIISEAGPFEIWLYELERETLSRFTFSDDAQSSDPIWSPDGNWIYFGSNRRGELAVYRRRSDGSGEAEHVNVLAGRWSGATISPDGSELAAAIWKQGRLDIWIVSTAEESEARPFLDTQFQEYDPAFSPDGRFIAYASDESGRPEVYVRAYPTGGKWQISTDGGEGPTWSRDGRELFYNNGSTMMMVSLDSGPSFQAAGPASRVFDLSDEDAPLGFHADVSLDGQSFLVVQERYESERVSAYVVLNWHEELKRLAPID